MNNTTDTFEDIASDAVELLITIAQDLSNSEEPGDRMAADLIAATAASFCRRAIALGGE